MFQTQKWFSLCLALMSFLFPIQTLSLMDPTISADGNRTQIFIPAIFKDYDASWQWENLQEFALTPTPLKTMTVIDVNGRLHIFWDVWPSSGAFIYHRYQTSSGWSVSEAIAPTLGNSNILVPPVAGPDGSVHIVWKNSLNFGGPYRLMYAVWKNGTWSPEAELNSIATNSVSGLLSLDDTGQPRVVFSGYSDAYSTGYYLCRPTSTGCSSKIQLPTTKYLTHYPFIDHTGGVVIVSEGYQNGVKRIYYSYWKDSALLIDNHEISGTVNYRGGLIDRQNNINFYRSGSVPVPGGNVYGIYQQCLASNFAWGPDQVISGQSNVAISQFAASTGLNLVSGRQASYGSPVVLDVWENCVSINTKTSTLPPPSTSSWGALASLASSDSPRKICLLMPVLYASSKFGVYCANIGQ